MDRKFNNILVTGGAGFIGSNFIHFLFKPETAFSGRVVNLDKLTYAGNLENLIDIHESYGGTRYFFEQADICDRLRVEDILKKYEIDAIVHFAAESHVDRSIHGPEDFIRTNVYGTFTLLDAVRGFWKGRKDVLFHHISTDEVYGSLGETGLFTETTPYDPRSPYSASKASSDHLVKAYWHTYGIPVTVSNCSNNYGPYQFPEKLIPLVILNILNGKPLPVYGEGKNMRDWLYVEDHNAAVWLVMKKGNIGETYNIGSEYEIENIDIVKKLIKMISIIIEVPEKKILSTIEFVKDRPGHDLRYAIDSKKIRKELGWSKVYDLDIGLNKTINWYIMNKIWLKRVASGEYRDWINLNYFKR